MTKIQPLFRLEYNDQRGNFRKTPNRPQAKKGWLLIGQGLTSEEIHKFRTGVYNPKSETLLTNKEAKEKFAAFIKEQD